MRSFLLLLSLYTFISIAAYAEPQSGDDKTRNASRALILNNEGVKLLNAHDVQLAIAKFQEALRLDPSCQLAKDNLAVAYNDRGLQLKDNPKEAIKQFHKSMFYDPNNLTTKSNLEELIRNFMKKDPASFKDRVDLGDQARLSGDFEGAVIEYQAAFHLKDDAAVKQKLEKLANVRRAMDKNAIRTALPSGVTDFDQYIADVERRVKACGPQSVVGAAVNESKSVIVICTIARNGKVSNVHLDHVSDGSALDKAALEEVKKAAPFPPLPQGAPDSIDIELTLNLKAISSTTNQ